jgi:outer membrane protein TolC
VGYSSFPNLGYPGVLFAVIPSYTMNIFSQIKEQKKANYELYASQAERDGVKLAVIGQIATSYFTYSAQVEQLQLFQQLDTDLTKLVTISNRILHGGIISQINLEEAKRELNLIRAEKRLVQHNIVISQNALRYLLNENPQAIPLSRRFDQLNGNQIVIGSLPLTVIENRPDMIQAANELKASNEGIGLAFSNLLPAVQLSMARGYIGTTPNGDDLGQSIHFNQALMEIPLFQASVYGQIDKAKGLNKASYYRYTDTLRKVLRDINNDMSAHDLYTQRLVDTENAKNNEQHIYDLNTTLYKKGITSYMQLVIYKVKLDSLLIQVNQSKLEQLITIVNLYQDLAGGYNYPAVPSTILK